MFGAIEIPATLAMEPLQLEIAQDGKAVVYRRALPDDVVEKKIYTKRRKSFFINPVEPTNTPKPLCTHVLIELDQPVVVEPQSECPVFVTFPIEIGVFVAGKRNQKLIDVFSLGQPQYTLYGQPTGGIICRYGHSHVHLAPPEVNNAMEGVLELTIMNDTAHWNEITRVVFSAYHMKLFFSDDMVFMRGNMKISDKVSAEIRIDKTPNRQGLKSSVEIYSLSKLSITQSSFIMEHGL